MFTILSSIGFIAVAVLVFKYFTGRKKSRNSKSSLESIASTLGGKIERSLKSASDGLRDVDTIKAELLNKLDKSKAKAKEDYAKYLVSVLTSKKTHLELIERAKINITKYKNKATELKAKFTETGEVKYKDYAKKSITQVLVMERQIATSQSVVDNAEDIKLDAGFKFDLLIANIENKRAEVITLACSPENTFAFDSVDISELTLEFKDKASERDIQLEVSRTLSNTEESSAIEQVDSSDVDSMWDDL